MSAERPGADSSSIAGGSDPFVEAEGDKFYFITPALRQRIELVRHLIDFGRQIIMLTGPPGAGKSMLLGRVTDAQEKSWRVLRFVAGPTLNHATLLTKIASELGIENPAGDVRGHVESVRKAVKAASQRGETTILAIDDADALPVDTSACLAQLAHSIDEAAELKVLLSADPAQSPLIDRLQSETSQHALVHVVEIPRLNEEQTGAMLTHRWTAAYGNDDIPLSSLEMAQIYRQSNGIAGKAIVLARQVQILAKNRGRLPLRDPAQRYLIGGLAVIVLFVLFAFFNQDDRSDGEDRQISVELPAAAVPMVEQPAPVPARKAEPELAQIQVDTGESFEEPAVPPVDRAPASLRSVATPTPLAQTPLPAATAVSSNAIALPADDLNLAAADNVIAREPEPAVSVKQPSPIEPVKETPPVEPVTQAPPAKPVEPVAPAKKPPPATARPTGAEPYSIEWLRSKSAAGYVLQLFGVRDRLAATKFIKDRKIGDKSAVLVTRHAGEPWFVVVFGYYPDRASAQAAIPNLPANLTVAKPWARPIASLN